MSSVSVKQLFWVSLAAALISLLALAAIDMHLRTPLSPAGIVSFEVCAYSSSCADIVESWGPHAQLMAALSLGIDYLFMVAYPAAICFGLLIVAPYVPHRRRNLTVVAAWSAWLAGAADAVENFCLARMLVLPSAQEFAWPASLSATVKFVVLGCTLGWLIVAYICFVLLRPGAEKTP